MKTKLLLIPLLFLSSCAETQRRASGRKMISAANGFGDMGTAIIWAGNKRIATAPFGWVLGAPPIAVGWPIHETGEFLSGDEVEYPRMKD